MTLSTTTKGEDLMTIAQAIQQAKENYDWQPVPGEPASVQVRFINRDGQDDETELNLYADNKEQELGELWASLHDEMSADLDSITGVSLIDLQ